MLRLIDMQTQQSLDLPVPDSVLAGFRAQLARGQLKSKSAKLFRDRLTYRIENAVHESLDWSLQPPFRRELMNAAIFAMTEDLSLPEEILGNRRLLLRFLRDHGYSQYQAQSTQSSSQRPDSAH